MAQEAPYHWIKKVEEGLTEAKIIPLWGSAPPFPWEECANRLSQVLSASLSLSPQETQWRSHEDLLVGLGENPIHFTVELTPLSSVVHWIFPSSDIEKLVIATLSEEPNLKSFSDPDLLEGFYTFLAAKAMYAVESLKTFGDLSLKFVEKQPLPEEGALCLDVAIKLKEETIWGRLISPPAFLHTFRQYFHKIKSALFSTELRQTVEVDLHFEVGRTTIPLKDLKRTEAGDFLLLDHCSFDPKTKKGLLTAFLDSTALFRAELADRELTILDYSFYHEENNPMPRKNINEDEDDPFDDPDEFDEDDDEDEDEDGEDEDEDEDLEEEDEFESEEELEEPEEGGEEGFGGAPEPREKESLKEVIATEQIPVTLTVEIARLRMNLDKLLELKPGNVLELAVNIQEPVTLRMNGKKIARGELIKLGDLLGVKILRIGEV
jgi:flagellar motor switch protein FliN